MTPETEQYNTQQWDILQEDYKEESLINPLINELTVDNEPAVLTPQVKIEKMIPFFFYFTDKEIVLCSGRRRRTRGK